MRDTRKDSEYFKKYLDYQYSRIEKKTAKLKESDEEKRQRILVSLMGYEIDLLKAEFSAGASKDNIKVLLNRAIMIANEYKNITHEDLLTLLSLAIMVDDKSEAVELIKNNTVIIGNDRLLKYYANIIQGENATWDRKIPLRSEYSALDGVFEASDKEKALRDYLDSWYRNHSGYAWYDSHNGSSDTYCGYWSFESSAIAIIMGIDDRNLKKSIYYPSI